MAKPSLFGVTPDKLGMKTPLRLNPNAVRGIESSQKNPKARNEKKATNSIEGIGYGIL